MGIEQLEGKTLLACYGDVGDSVMTFVATDGMYRLYHYQSCCENVQINEIIGDLDDLVGAVIIEAGRRSIAISETAVGQYQYG